MSFRRIAVLEPVAQMGGAQISLLELVRALDGAPRVVVILPEDGPLRVKAQEAGAEVHILPWPSGLMKAGERAGGVNARSLARALIAGAMVPGLALRLERLLRRVEAEVLVTNGIKAHIVGTAAAYLSRRPLVWYLRDLLEGREMSSRALHVIAGRCNGAVAISRCVAEEAARVLSPSIPSRVIYNLVDFDRFHKGLPGPQDLAKDTSEIWFGVAGALTPLKGQDIFLQAAAIVARRLPQARFVLVGTNFYRTEHPDSFEGELRRMAQSPELRGKVMFLGHRTDMPALFNAIDVLVQPNRGPEALGRSIMEAMACEVPTIAVDRWGPAELVADGKTGLLSPWLDVPALAERMIRLGCDAALRAQLGRAASEWIHRTLSPTAIPASFRDLLAVLR